MKNGDRSETQLILDSIRRIVRALRVSSRFLERTHGLTSAQVFVLQKLESGEPISVNELARRTFTHQSSVSVVVSRLAERGLVTRRAAKDDGRRVEVKITEKAQALLRKAPELIQNRLVEVIQGLPKSDRACLATHLSAVVEAAGLIEGEVSLFFEEGSDQ